VEINSLAHKAWIRNQIYNQTFEQGTIRTSLTLRIPKEFTKSHTVSTSMCCQSKVVPGLNKYHAMKTYPALNRAPRHEDVWGNWVYRHSTHS